MSEIIKKIGNPINTTFILSCVKGIEDGRDVIYFSVVGFPSSLVCYDVNERKVLRCIKHKEKERLLACWTHLKASDGKVYMADFGSTASILCYDPETGVMENIAALEGEIAAYHLCEDGKGNIYTGTALGGKLFSLNTADRSLKCHGNIIPGEKYICSGAVIGDNYYGGTRSENPVFFRYSLLDGETEIIPLPERVKGDANAVYYMTAVDKYIFATIKGNSETYTVTCYNTEEKKWENVFEKGMGGQHMSEAPDGITYFIGEDGAFRGIRLSDLKTVETGITYYCLKKGDDGYDYANGLMGGGFYRLENQKKYPGYTYITSNYDNNSLVYVNLERKTVEFVKDDLPQDTVQIKALHNTPDGKIVMGGYMGTKGCLYNPEDGSIEEFFCRQTEGITTVGNKNYFGVYTRAAVWEFDSTKPFARDVNPREIFSVGYQQDRPFALCEADGNLVVGTIPDYYKLGGAFTIYNTATGEKTVYDSLIENQSITGLCYRDGIIYGSTGIWGGLSTKPVETKAKIFSFDLEKRELIRVNEPEFSFAETDVMHIGGMTVDSSGNIWAVTSGVVFRINPETLEVEETINIYGINWNTEKTTWKPFSIVESNGFLYANPEDMLVRINLKTREVREYNERAFMLTANKDGNIYFCRESEFFCLETSKEEN